MLRARLSCVLIAVVLGNISARGQANQTFSVDQLIEAGLERNRDFLAAKQRLAEAQGLLRQAGVRPAPTIEVEGTTERPSQASQFHRIRTDVSQRWHARFG
jgi:hypothetical protein